MTQRQPRRAQSHTVEGEATDLDRAASGAYPEWPTEIVQRPAIRSVRQKADRFYDLLRRQRTPEGWGPADVPRLALLARTLAYFEREQFNICERRGGDQKHAKDLQSQFAQLSRQLGLNTSEIDPRLHGSARSARRDAQKKLHDLGGGDDLLAMPGSPSPFDRPN
jgi:hypothetical protein